MGNSAWKSLITGAWSLVCSNPFDFSKERPENFLRGADLWPPLGLEGKVLMMGEREKGFVTIYCPILPLASGAPGAHPGCQELALASDDETRR